MKLKKVEIKNYRLLLDTTLNLDNKTTLIVGRNNSGKTSLIDFLYKIINKYSLKYDDYPLIKRKELFELISKFLKKEKNYDELLTLIPKPSVKFIIDYSSEADDEDLGALSPFIIDLDEESSEAIIVAEYSFKMLEDEIFNLFLEIDFSNLEKIKEIVQKQFDKFFSIKIKALNPVDKNDTQEREIRELQELFPTYIINAERDLDETGNNNKSSLSSVISKYFNIDLEKIEESVLEDVKKLRKSVEEKNSEIQTDVDKALSEIINKTIGFGYPNSEELQLGIFTNLKLSNQIENSSQLAYYNNNYNGEQLPSNYNGLGYKNLIKIQFELAQFAEKLKGNGEACIPLLFIEEPEAHMHPQMQQVFISYLDKFLGEINSNKNIQAIVTTHSSHIVSAADFSKIRYCQKISNAIKYKDLNDFCNDEENKENKEFIRKYLTLTKSDLFFADKAILIEGAAERLFLNDMIAKCKEKGEFKTEYDLSSQYYTFIEVGGAYAHKFIPFCKFLDIPTLILTDIDSVKGKSKCLVKEGNTTSNYCIKYWVSIKKGKDHKEILLKDIINLTDEEKTDGRIHIEYQTEEYGFCGRSLEEALINVNRSLFNLPDDATEEHIKFPESKSKTDFAIELIFDKKDYNIPEYIRKGLVWLNNQNVII